MWCEVGAFQKAFEASHLVRGQLLLCDSSMGVRWFPQQHVLTIYCHIRIMAVLLESHLPATHFGEGKGRGRRKREGRGGEQAGCV